MTQSAGTAPRRRSGLLWSRPVLIALLLLAVSATGLVTPTARAAVRTIVFEPVSSGYTDLWRPGWVSATADPDQLKVSKHRFRSYLEYDLAALSTVDEVTSATLTLTVASSDARDPGLEISSTTTGWASGALSHDRAPATGSLLNPDDPAVPASGSTISSPLTDLSALRPGAPAGLALGYDRSFTTLALATTALPTLTLTVRSGHPIPAVDTSKLPYALAATGSSPRKVFAHYFPPYPISIDDAPADRDYYTTHYLNPSGEGGKYLEEGGLMRDRPLGRDPLGGDYRLADAETEVRQAATAGIDGFTVDILTWSGDLWDTVTAINTAAANSPTEFVTVPNLDVTSSAAAEPIPVIADRLAEFYAAADKAAYRLDDGRYVLSSFKAEDRPVDWWQELFTELQTRHGISVAFIAVMLELNAQRIHAYAPIAYAMSIWGVRTPKSIRNAPQLAAAVHHAGVAWMAPIAVQDVRYRELRYGEAGNTETLRASWERALSDHADFAQLITWNDYSESTQFAPSQAHGKAFLDLNGYYQTQFKNGTPPSITGDELILTHRIQSVDAEPSAQRARMNWKLSGSAMRPRDTVEVVTMLAEPADIVLRVGETTTSYRAPAGLFAQTAPLSVGSVEVKASREGVPVAAAYSPYPVRAQLDTWDLQYYAITSRES